MAVRLARIDARPLDLLVDLTNYVMFDIGYPMHAFDASKIENKKLIARCARTDEKMTLLDGEEVTLTSHDCVIADGAKALSVAGVMGASIKRSDAQYKLTNIRSCSLRSHGYTTHSKST